MSVTMDRMGGGRRPMVRVNYRKDRGQQTARWAFTRFEPWVTPMAIAAGTFIPAIPSDAGQTEGFALPLTLSISAVLLFLAARRWGLLPAAALAVPYVAVYAAGLGDASLHGVVGLDLYASSGSVLMAISAVVVFLTVLVLGSGATDWVLRRFIPKMAAPDATDRLRRVVSMGLVIQLVVTMLISIAVGSFTFRGADISGPDRTGGMRWEFLYEPALVSMFALVVDQIVRCAEGRGGRLRLPMLTTILGALVLLLFIRQGRRVMALPIIVGFFQIAWNEHASRRWLGSPMRTALILLGLGGLMFVLNLGSMAWRKSAAEFSTNDLSQRFSDIAARVGDTDELRDTARVEAKARLNYLWLDAASVEYQPIFTRVLSLPEMFISTVYYALPGAIVPAKYTRDILVCETAFEEIHFGTDLPCTPTSEGFIAFGMLGVIIVALSWTPVVGFACFLMRNRSALGIICAMHLLDPMCLIETSAFPQVLAIRSAILGLGALAVTSMLGVLFFGWGVLSPNKDGPRTVAAHVS